MKCPYCSASISLLHKGLNPSAGEVSRCPTCGKEVKFALARGRFAMALIPLLAAEFLLLPTFGWARILATGGVFGIAAFFALKLEGASET